MKPKFTESQLWEAAQTCYHAAEYLQNDAGERDIYWTKELNDAAKILNDAGYIATTTAVKVYKRFFAKENYEPSKFYRTELHH